MTACILKLCWTLMRRKGAVAQDSNSSGLASSCGDLPGAPEHSAVQGTRREGLPIQQQKGCHGFAPRSLLGNGAVHQGCRVTSLPSVGLRQLRTMSASHFQHLLSKGTVEIVQGCKARPCTQWPQLPTAEASKPHVSREAEGHNL